MSQLVRAAVLVVPAESPPPQPATATATDTASTRGRARFKAAASLFFGTLRRVISAAIVMAALTAAVLAQSGGASPVAHAASYSACDISGQQQNLGASYVTSLKVQGVGCTKAEKVIR